MIKGDENQDVEETYLGVNFLQRVEARLKGRTAKVGDRAQAREQTPVQHLLEVPLTDVLGEEVGTEDHSHAWPGPALGPDSVPPALPGWPGLPAWWS